MASLIITSPLKGWALPLDEVPDPVFADRLMGNGIAIHPLGSTVHAPFDGEVINVHASRHAVTLRSDEGAEILIHVGLDTVALGGTGFTALVEDGARVSRGDPLIEFDLDSVGMKATSLVTPVIVTNSDLFRIDRTVSGQMVGVGELLMQASAIEAEARIWGDDASDIVRRNITVPLVHGIHARPAARIGEFARGFEAEIEMLFGEKRANVRSAIALMGLGVKMGQGVALEARGKDAAAALQGLGDLIIGGLGERPAEAPPALKLSAATTAMPEGALRGVIASTGIAIGTTAWLSHEDEIEVAQHAEDPAIEAAALGKAVDLVSSQLAEKARGEAEQRHIFEAHQAFLADSDLRSAALQMIREGRSAGFAWRSVLRQQAALFEASGDSRIAERVADLKDLEQQVLRALTGASHKQQLLATKTILLADDLLPSQLIELDRKHIAAIVLREGGPTSHVAILAASMNIPMLVAIGADLERIPDGNMVVVDANYGFFLERPTPDQIDHYRDVLAQRAKQHADAMSSAHHDCRTADGKRIEAFANLGSLDDAILAVKMGAEGSGLLRTEFLFMERVDAPDEEEQRQCYQAIADTMAGRPIIIRLLDIGGDKPAPYLDLGNEKNPVLGLRGIRVSLAHPELLETQIGAILRVNPMGQCKIMVPMVASLSELRAVRATVDRVRLRLGLASSVQLGVMIETPAAAATADLIAAEADFLSIGTNDLTQYVLAMDRENPSVAGGIDALHPGVLRLIATACQGGRAHGKPVGVCGGLASDPLSIPLLIGFGVSELSTTPNFIPEAKALIRRLEFSSCEALCRRATEMTAAEDIRALTRAFIEELG